MAHPHRVNFYALGMCYAGNIKLHANLDTYFIQEGSVVLIGPEIIRKWEDQTMDYTAKALLFTEDCFTAAWHEPSILRSYDFYLQPQLPKVFQPDLTKRRELMLLIDLISRTIQSDSHRKEKIIQSYLSIVLNKVADMYEETFSTVRKNSLQKSNLINRFKVLVLQNCLCVRSVDYYAKQLHVSSKHLSEAIKSETGKTAGEWIHDFLILEAKVRLKQTDQLISQISDTLHFAHATLFTKYFKRYVGESPIEYRESQILK